MSCATAVMGGVCASDWGFLHSCWDRSFLLAASPPGAHSEESPSAPSLCFLVPREGSADSSFRRQGS